MAASVAASAAWADDPSPICARPAVLERVQMLLQQAGRAMRLDPVPVGEHSAGTDRIVRCAVQGQMLGYDTPHHGTEPIDAIYVVRYTLELRQNGIFVSID